MPRTGENIYKRRDGRWEGRFIKDHAAPKTRYGYIYGKTYKEVKKRLIEAKAEWESKEVGVLSVNPENSFSDIAGIWLESSKSLFKESTLVKYKNLLRLYILPAIGEYPINKITNERICELADNLLKTGGAKGQGLSPKTVADSLSLLRSIEKYALKRDMDVNFSSGGYSIKQRPKHLRVLSLQEQQVLCSYLKTNMTLSNLGILTCLFSGIRIGELCALKWGGISISERTLYVHQTMQRLSAENETVGKTQILITNPKSSCSVRVIPLPDILMEEMQRMQQPWDSYFLTGEKDKFVEPRTMQNRFKVVLKSCNLADANFHSLRHTFATRCVEAGFDIKSLSEILGHSNVNITLNRYVHPTMELKKENMSRLSNLFTVR